MSTRQQKIFLRGQFREWYAKQVCSQLDRQNAVDLRLSVLKPLGAAWINSMHAYITNNPSLVINGFKEAGILVVCRVVKLEYRLEIIITANQKLITFLIIAIQSFVNH